MASLELSIEALIATTGVFPEHPVSLKHIEKAEELPKAWAGKIRAWLEASAQPQPPPVPSVPYLDTWNKLAAPPDDSELAAGLGDQVRVAYLQGIATARAYLKEKWGALYRETFMGREVLPPSTSQQQRASAIYGIVNDPSLLLGDLAAGSITDEVMDAIENLNPALFDMVKAIIDAERVRLKERKGYALAWWKESSLRQMLGMPPGQPMAPLPVEPPKALPKVEIEAKADKLHTKAQQVAAA